MTPRWVTVEHARHAPFLELPVGRDRARELIATGEWRSMTLAGTRRRLVDLGSVANWVERQADRQAVRQVRS